MTRNPPIVRPIQVLFRMDPRLVREIDKLAGEYKRNQWVNEELGKLVRYYKDNPPEVTSKGFLKPKPGPVTYIRMKRPGEQGQLTDHEEMIETVEDIIKQDPEGYL